MSSKERTPLASLADFTEQTGAFDRLTVGTPIAETRRMATDRYIRIVLTVIAVCLVYLCLRDGAPLVQAQAQRPLEVVLVGVDRARYRFDRWDDLPVRATEPVKVDSNVPLNVTLKNTNDLTVRLNEPLKVDTSQPLKVRVDPYPPIEVKVTNTPLNVNVANTNR